MAGWALRVSARTASPDSITSSTSQPSRIEARWNGQPAGSSAQGAPLPLGIRPWPGKVKAIFSTVDSIVPAERALANKHTNEFTSPAQRKRDYPLGRSYAGPCGPDRPAEEDACPASRIH